MPFVWRWVRKHYDVVSTGLKLALGWETGYEFLKRIEDRQKKIANGKYVFNRKTAKPV